jgi:long-chain acyl-CoA synthetase
MHGNIAHLVPDAAGRAPDRVALRADDTSLTWAELAAAVSGTAAGLRRRTTPGDRVALALPNGIDFAVAYFAALTADCVAVPLDPGYPPAALAGLVEGCGAALLVAEPGVQRTVPERDGLARATGYRELVADGEPVAPGRSGEDLAVLLHTSGTSGTPRGAMLSHRALLANVEQLAGLDPAPVGADDVVLLALPLSHAYGLGPGLHSVLRHGATGVLVPRFDPAATLDTIEAAGVTCVLGVPAMYSAWCRQDGFAERFAGVRLAVCGAASLPYPVREAVAATGARVAEGYGLTEAGPVVTSTLASPRAPAGLMGAGSAGAGLMGAGSAGAGSVGRPLPGVGLGLIGPDGDLMSPEDYEADENASPGTDPGEIVVRGDNLFSGYWPDGAGGPEADGWWRTGDLGYLDESGELFLVDRLGELIVVSGFHVYPREVEAVLAGHPAVAEAAVIGVPDPATGQAVMAYIVLGGGVAAGEPPTEEELLAHCRRSLPTFKRPVRLRFVDHLPHSATGKVRKSDLVVDA